MLSYPAPSLLIVDVTDRLPGKVKQRVVWDNTLKITPQTDGSIAIELPTTVRLFEALPDGAYGAELSQAGFLVQPVVLRSDNLTAVDVSGKLRYLRASDTALTVMDLVSGETLTLPAVEGNPWLAWLDAHPDTLMLQNFYFKQVFDTKRVGIRALVEYNIKQADVMGRYRFS